MPLGALALLATAGLAVGFVSGLIGVGGGVLIVPFLYFLYAFPGWFAAPDPALHVTVAHATSLLVIVPTAVRGTLTYHRAGLVAWRVALPIAAASVVAAVAGARLAVLLPGTVLKVGFGLLLVVSGIQLLARRAPPGGTAGEMRLGAATTLPTGVAVGLLSAALGVGGGLVAIPPLIYLVRLDMRRVAATSLAIVVFAATAGVVTYMLSGGSLLGRPEGSVGYVDVAAAVPLLIGATVAVPWGARANQRLPVPTLRRIFAVFFVAMGARLIVVNLGGFG